MKRVVLVNGVPASGKSTLARALATETGWPLLALDTVKEALFEQLGGGDRARNRLLGQASYRAIFALIGDFPADATVLVDAWFGFQPREILDQHLKRAGGDSVVEVWCRAPAQTIAARYAERVSARSGGHLGLDYVPELLELARSATPLGSFALVEVDCDSPISVADLAARIVALFAKS